jgi:hypothetical protein
MQEGPTLEDVLKIVQRLSRDDQRRLIERVASEVEEDRSSRVSMRGRSLLGLVKDLGPAPSEEEIDSARKEAWSGFPRQDI